LSLRRQRRTLASVKLLLENLPPSLQAQRESLAQCLEAMNRVLPLTAVYLFGSHVRGEARPDSDVDLCLVADGATEQLKAAQKCREAIWHVWPCPAFSLIPITPQRLNEKQAIGDHFFATILREGVRLAA
jgi:UTP:GlnB (protein PII) uridylyltransferase